MRVNSSRKSTRRGGGHADLRWTRQNDIDLYGGEWWSFLDTAAGSVSALVSRDGTGQTAIQATPGSQPVNGASGMSFDGIDDSLAQASTANVVVLINRADYPDDATTAAGLTPGIGGVSCGIWRAPGTTDQFWTLTYGPSVTQASDGGSRNPSVIRVQYPGGPGSLVTKLQEIVLKPLYPSISGMQDIVVDPDDGTLWCAVAEGSMAGQAIHLTTSGVVIPSIMQASWPISGIAIVPANAISAGSAKRMWFVEEAASGNNMESRSMVDNSVINAAVSTGLSNQDGLFYDSETVSLTVSYGANAAAGKLRIYSLTGASGGLCNTGDVTLPPEWDAVEQVIWEGRKFYGVCDRNYHVPPSLHNAVLEGIGIHPMSTRLHVQIVASVSATTGTDCLLEFGSPLDGTGPGWGIYPTSTTGINVIANTGASGTGQQSTVASGAISSLSASKRILDFVFDFRSGTGGKTVQIWVDGTFITTGTLANCVGSLPFSGVMRIGTSKDNRFCSCVISEIALICGPSDLARQQGVGAWDNGLQGNLPANHLWKNTRPTP